MKQNTDSNEQRGATAGEGPESNGADEVKKPSGKGPRSQNNGHAAPQKLDFWMTLDILANRWHWLAIGGILFAGVFFYLGTNLIKEKFTATGQLRRIETPEFFKAAPTSSETFAALIRSPDLLREIGEQADPPISGEDLAKCLKVDPQPDSDMVKVLLQTRDPGRAVALLNSYMKAAVHFTKEMQTRQAARLSDDYLKEQVQKMNDDITTLQKQFRGLGDTAAFPGKTNGVGGGTNSIVAVARMASPEVAGLKLKLQATLVELDDALRKYTDLHPTVIATRDRIGELQKRITEASTSTNTAGGALPYTSMAPATAPRGVGVLDPEADIIRMKLLALEEANVQLVKNQREAELYARNPPGMAVVFAEATGRTLKSNMRWVKVSAASVFGAGLGMFLSFMLIALVELTDSKLRTTDDLHRVTKLPVLTTLGDLKRMDDGQRAQWAFRAWTMLQGRLSLSANHGLVCGITSSASREGRSTWISLLAEAASLTGFRVLTIATKPSPTNSEEEEFPKAIPENIAEEEDMNASVSVPATANSTTAMVQNALKTPATVTDQLTGPDSQPVVHIPLPGWVWNLERRREWGDALDHWRQIDNLVILVELPPADVPEAVLLGANLPNLVWLADSGTAHAGETRTQLETLRDARCNLVGAVLNREPAIPIKKRFPRWLGCVAFGIALSLSSAQAQNADPGTNATSEPTVLLQSPTTAEPTRTNLSFSIVRPAQRAAWQEHLTLGPGDLLNLGLYGQPELARAEVSIGPDGRLSYLEAQDVDVTGLTVDELRNKLDQELAKYRRTPRTLITPVAFRSKRYYMLGKVITKGVYVLDRPITVLEAIARAHGLENGLVERNVIDLADFQRSFLARNGKRYPLNFEKLFQEGDLSQNIPIEPGDYIYFPSTTVKEVYVVGEVRLPGTAIYKPDLSIIAAISSRGGYTDRAYRSRVLVVRGSVNNPEAFAVDTRAILEGKVSNFRLQPRDIVYVNSRPFIKVEEIVDMAFTAFIQSLITEWTGVGVVKPIQ